VRPAGRRDGVNGVSRGLLSSGLLLVAVLLVVATSGAAAGDLSRLAAVAGGAVALRALFLAPGVGRAFGPFAEPIDLGASLALVFFALSLTGGLSSELFPLLLLEIVLARLFDGPAASRFVAVAACAGAAALAIPGVTAGVPPTVGTALRIAWPAALLLVLEVAGRRAQTTAPAEAESRKPAAAESRPVPPPAAPVRDPRQELFHDLRSPLSVVRVYADLIAEDVRRGEPPRPEHLANLGNEIGLMEALVGVTRPAAAAVPLAAPPPRTDLVKLLASLAESYDAAHGDKLRIEFVADEETIAVAADPVAVQRALRNVLDNAVKYTPPGGQIRIRASAVAQHVFVVISDTGIGMTREEQKRAFEYAWRGEAARATGAEGRGLGLALVRELLEAQGGKISLLSEPGHGLEVTIMFPLVKRGAA
jgi:signal transduction histidine kinase